MFCPRCKAQDENEESYCRKCGLPLASVRLAVEGHADRALAAYKRGGDLVAAGMITLCIAVFIALMNFFLSSGPRNYGVLVNLLWGLAIGLPLMITGALRASRAEHLLNDSRRTRELQNKDQSKEPLSVKAGAEPEVLKLAVPDSVTEGTTRKLEHEA